MESFDVLQGEASVVGPSSPSGFLAEEALKRSIRRAAFVEAPHDAIESVPEIVRGPQSLAEDLPPPATDVDGGECCLPRDLLELGRAAVDEFGAQLDRNRRGGVAMREDASADSFARLEHDDVDVVFVKRAGGSEAGRASSDDGDIHGGRGAFDHESGPLEGEEPSEIAPREVLFHGRPEAGPQAGRAHAALP